MNTGVWFLILLLNGHTVDFPDPHKTSASCEEHRKRMERAFKQAESNAVVRCEYRP